MSFAKTGTYTYYCVLHPNMVGTDHRSPVTPRTRSRRSPRPATRRRRKYLKEGEAAKAKLLEDQAQDHQELRRLHHLHRRRWARRRRTPTCSRSRPRRSKVKSGDQVTFVNNSAAPHTASFGGTLVPDHPDRRQRRATRYPVRRRRRWRRAPTSTPGGCRRRRRRARRSPPAATPTRCRRRASTPTRACCTSRAAWPARSTRADRLGRALAEHGALRFWGRLLPGTRRNRHGSPRTDRGPARQGAAVLGLSKKELRLISQLATYLEEPAGTVLTEEGKPGHEFIIVLDGEIEVRQGGKVVAERGAGAYVGRDRAARPPAPHRDRRRQDAGGDRGDRPARVRGPARRGARALPAAARHRGPAPGRPRPAAGTQPDPRELIAGAQASAGAADSSGPGGRPGRRVLP